MPIHEVRYSSHFRKSLRKLDPPLQKKARDKLRLFLQNPFDPRLDTHKLSGRLKNYWSFSVTTQHRILFEFIRDEVIGLVDIRTHSVYRR